MLIVDGFLVLGESIRKTNNHLTKVIRVISFKNNIHTVGGNSGFLI